MSEYFRSNKKQWLGLLSKALLLLTLIQCTSIYAQSELTISEFHYDNSGVDEGEAIEISGPVGTELDG